MVRASAVAVRPRRVEGEGDCGRWLPDTPLCSSLGEREEPRAGRAGVCPPPDSGYRRCRQDGLSVGRSASSHQLVPLPWWDCPTSPSVKSNGTNRRDGRAQKTYHGMSGFLSRSMCTPRATSDGKTRGRTVPPSGEERPAFMINRPVLPRYFRMRWPTPRPRPSRCHGRSPAASAPQSRHRTARSRRCTQAMPSARWTPSPRSTGGPGAAIRPR